jgi:copper chaperone
MQTIQLAIQGMHCDGCAARIKTMLERKPGVREADVSFHEEHARVRFNENAVGPAQLVEVIEHAGFEVTERS